MRDRATFGARALMVALALGLPCIAGAQRFEGRVSLPTGEPAERVLVEVTRGDGTVAARTLTDDGGRYMVSVSGAGTYGLRALRIGFRPTVIPARAVTREDRVTQVIELTASAVRLGEIRVATDAVCTPAWRGDSSVLAIWEEARKALQTAQLTANRSDLAMTVSSIEALASSAGVIHPTTRTAFWREATTVRPFESVADSTIATQGYVVALANGETIYRAPDFDVLLAPSFAATHCMRIIRSSERPASIGLEFEPNRERMRSDIAGIIWLDRATAHLQEIRFRFTGIAGANAGRGDGGRVRFLPLDTGHWIVSAWELRMPRAEGGALNVIGGEVGEVVRGDEVLYTTGGSFVDVEPTQESVIAMVCGEDALGAPWGMLRGEVNDPNGLPARAASVRVTWAAGVGGQQELNVSTNDDGTWHVCRVPRLAVLDVVAMGAGRTARGRVRIGREERLAELMLSLRDGR